MKNVFLFIVLLLTVCSTAMAQTESKHYVNVRFENGTVRSFEATPNMKVTFGEKEEADPTSINGHPCVKLAGYYWATENIGESKVPAVAGPGTDGNDWNSYFYTIGDDNAMSAALFWGHEGDHEWTLPNMQQWDALMNNCYWEWTDDYNGKSGYIVYEAKSDGDKGKIDIENSGYMPTIDTHIFLPAAGWYNSNELKGKEIVDQGSLGYYCLENNGTECQYFRKGSISIGHFNLITDGQALRLVSK